MMSGRFRGCRRAPRTFSTLSEWMAVAIPPFTIDLSIGSAPTNSLVTLHPATTPADGGAIVAITCSSCSVEYSWHLDRPHRGVMVETAPASPAHALLMPSDICNLHPRGESHTPPAPPPVRGGCSAPGLARQGCTARTLARNLPGSNRKPCCNGSHRRQPPACRPVSADKGATRTRVRRCVTSFRETRPAPADAGRWSPLFHPSGANADQPAPPAHRDAGLP